MDEHLQAIAEASAKLSDYHNLITQLTTLAIEYEAKTITAERFAKRSVEVLHSFLQVK